MPQNEAAFAQFYARYVDTVYRVCYIRMKNQTDAEDLTQETFLRAMEHPELWEDPVHGKAWCIVTASNLCKSALRHWFRTKRTEVADWETALGATEMPDEESFVWATVMDLPDLYRTVVYLYYFEDYSGAEIAAMLGKKESTIRSLLHRARKLLKKKLGGVFDAETEKKH